jgi:hypothetical protein
VDAESGRELALGLAVFGRQRHQHPVGPGLHTDAGHPPLKLAWDVRAELRQQKWVRSSSAAMRVG